MQSTESDSSDVEFVEIVDDESLNDFVMSPSDIQQALTVQKPAVAVSKALLAPPPSALKPVMQDPKSPRKRTPQEIEQKHQTAKAIRLYKESQQRMIEETTQNVAQGLAEVGVTIGDAEVPEEDFGDLPQYKWTPSPTCTPEQLEILQLVKEGRNVMFTGSAGVGKSFLLKEIKHLLSSIGKNYSVTATTGIASIQIGGRTIHSWAETGLAKDAFPQLVHKLSRKYKKSDKHRETNSNFETTEVLIIDEISMLDPATFDKFFLLAKFARNNNLPFGGIQLVVCGDFFQLPPVPSKGVVCLRCSASEYHQRPIAQKDSTLPPEDLPPGIPPYQIKRCSPFKGMPGCGYEYRERQFCFESEAWTACNFTVRELRTVFRQKEANFIVMLEKFRRGKIDADAQRIMDTLMKKKAMQESLRLQEDGTEIKIIPTNLYPTKKRVLAENNQELAKLTGKLYTYHAQDNLFGSFGIYPDKNDARARLNDVPADKIIQLKEGAQVILLHNLDPKRGLMNGSRGVIIGWRPIDIRNPPGMVNMGQHRGRLFESADYSEFYHELEEKLLPLVLFANGVTELIYAYTWEILIDNHHACARTQIPLGLAWALTIHRSQGQTLDFVNVDLEGVFSAGQAYVALSRARSLEGMTVTSFMPRYIVANEKVKVFYNLVRQNLPFRKYQKEMERYLDPMYFLIKYEAQYPKMKISHWKRTPVLPQPPGLVSPIKPAAQKEIPEDKDEVQSPSPSTEKATKAFFEMSVSPRKHQDQQPWPPEFAKPSIPSALASSPAKNSFISASALRDNAQDWKAKMKDAVATYIDSNRDARGFVATDEVMEYARWVVTDMCMDANTSTAKRRKY